MVWTTDSSLDELCDELDGGSKDILLWIRTLKLYRSRIAFLVKYSFFFESSEWIVLVFFVVVARVSLDGFFTRVKSEGGFTLKNQHNTTNPRSDLRLWKWELK